MKTIKIKIHPSKLQADIKTNDEIAQINLDSSVIYSPLDASFINNQTVSECIDKNGKYFITYDRTKYTGLDTAVVDVSVNDASAYNRGVEEGKEEQKALMTSLVVTENGTYSRPDGYSDVSVNVPSEVPQQDASVTYTQNGEYTILPDPGYALSKVDVSVALDTSAIYEEGRVVGRVEGYAQGYSEGTIDGEVAQKAKLTHIDVSANGHYEREDGYNSVDVSIEVPTYSSQTKSVVITQNGETTILPDASYDGLSRVDISTNIDTSIFYQEGYSDGQAVGYNNGYNQGETDGYNQGYPAGIAHQKSLLDSSTFTNNGTYNRTDGWNQVTVAVDTSTYYDQGYADGSTAGAQYQKSLLDSSTFTENGVYNRENGWNQVEVAIDTSIYYDQGFADGSTAGVAYQKSLLDTSTFTNNGIYSRENGWNQVEVAVDTSTYYDQGFADGSTAGVAYQKSLLDSSTFTANGTYTREDGWNSVTVDVPSSPGGSLQAKTTDASTSQVTVLPDASFYGLSSVTVNAVDASIDPNIIPENIKKDITILGVTGTLDSSTEPSVTYQTYEYLRYPNGHAFYDTGVTINLDTIMEIKTNILNDGAITHGNYTQNSDNSELRVFGAGGMFYYDRREGSYRLNGGSNDGTTIHTVEVGNFYLKVDDNIIATGNTITENDQYAKYSVSNIGIFGAYRNPDMTQYQCANGDVTVYYCKIYDGSTLVRDFVPATDASGNVGLLDKVNLEFYYNLDSGDASLGTYAGDYPPSGSVVYQSKTVDPSTNEQLITPDASDGYNALSSVTIKAVDASIDPDIIADNIKLGVNILGVDGTLVSSYNGRNQTKTVDASTVSQTVTFDSPDYTGLEEVVVNPYSLETLVVDSSTGSRTYTPSINYNGIGQITVRPYVLDTKTVNPSTSEVVVTSDASALSQVTVNPVTSSIDPNIQPENIKAGVNILGVTGELNDTVVVNLQDKTVTPSSSQLVVTADSSYDGLGTVYVNAAPVETATVDASTSQQTLTPSSGKVGFSQVTINPYVLQTKTVDSSTTQQTIVPDSSYDGLSQVVVAPYALQTKTIAPDTSVHTYTPDSSHNGFSQVTVNAVTASIDPNIQPANIVQGVTILGVTGTYTSPSSVSLGYEEIYRRLINI